MERTYCVYKHTTPSGKVYIGQTRAGAETRWKDGKGYTCHAHGWFWKAIQKYGWENIAHEILLDGLNKSEADYYERFYIAFYQSDDKRYGYNCTTGGSDGYKYTEDARRNISEGLKRHYAEHGKPDTSKARAALLQKTSRRVVQYDLFGNRIAEYSSAVEASEATGCSRAKINQALCIPHRMKQADGYMWRYAENAPEKIPPYKMKPRILLVDETGRVLAEYKTNIEAANALGCSRGTITSCLIGRYSYSKALKGKTLVYSHTSAEGRR